MSKIISFLLLVFVVTPSLASPSSLVWEFTGPDFYGEFTWPILGCDDGQCPLPEPIVSALTGLEYRKDFNAFNNEHWNLFEDKANGYYFLSFRFDEPLPPHWGSETSPSIATGFESYYHNIDGYVYRLPVSANLRLVTTVEPPITWLLICGMVGLISLKHRQRS